MNKKENGLMACSILLTEQQYDEITKTAKSLGCVDIQDFINRCLVIGKMVGNEMTNGSEVLLCNKEKTQFLEKTENNSKTVIVMGNQESILFVTEEMKNLVGFEEKIKYYNNWAMPTEPYKC
jgi:hypothetical protein